MTDRVDQLLLGHPAASGYVHRLRLFVEFVFGGARARAARGGFLAPLIAVAGIRIARVVDNLADRTGIGEGAAGAVLLGGATSLGGSVLSVTAAGIRLRKPTRCPP